jgi:putative membrane protein
MRTRNVVIGIVAVLVVLVVAALLVGGALLLRGQYGYGPGIMGPRGGFGFHHGIMMGGNGFPLGMVGGGILLFLFWIAVIVAVVVGIVALVRWSRRSHAGTGISQASPLDVLKLRYARGEINHDEYEQMKERLLSQ